MVKGELRALGQRTQQHQHQRGDVERMRADFFAGGQHHIQVMAADDVAQHQHTGQQAQAAGTRDGERHARTAPCITPVVPVADEQEGKQARQFPEQHQLDEVAREHHAAHRAHEGEQKREEARHRVGGRHVVARVQHHQRAYAQHQHREHPRKTVHAQHQIQAE